MQKNNDQTNAAAAFSPPSLPLEFEGQAVRMRIDEEGNPWWVARDVCDILGIQNANDALAKSIDEDEKGVDTVYTPGGSQQMATVNEAGLYSLILRSRKPDAKKFKRWVTHEVIPSIRRHGFYVRPGQDPVVVLMETLRDRRLAELEMTRRQDAMDRRLGDVALTANAALAVAQCNHGHYSVLGWSRLCGMKIDLQTASRVGKVLTAICERRGLPTERVRDPRFGSVRTYPESVLREFFGDFLNGRVEL